MNSGSGVVAQQSVGRIMRWEEFLSRKQEVFHSVDKDLGRLKLVDIGDLDIDSSVIAGFHPIPGQVVIRSGDVGRIVFGGTEDNLPHRVRQEGNRIHDEEIMNGELVSDQGKSILRCPENSPGLKVIPQSVRWGNRVAGVVYAVAVSVTQTGRDYNSPSC